MRAFFCILFLPCVIDAIVIQRVQLLGRGRKRKGEKRGWIIVASRRFTLTGAPAEREKCHNHMVF